MPLNQRIFNLLARYGVLLPRLFALILFALFVLTFSRAAYAWESYVGKTIDAKVTGFEEGNILLVKSDGKEFPVRFYGVGIPTLKQPFGAEAKEALGKLLPAGTSVVLTTVNADKEGVVSALVQHNDRSVNNRLIEEGLAWVDRHTCKAFFCRRWHIQEHIAIKERRGVWSVNMGSPPWQWSE
ncbi:MAG: thermonuclease family protein [Desulfovibrio sp.]|nr:thermonuclease family protein [Desulfovibrio sp.]